MELIAQLTEQLGISGDQAKGGTGLILNLLKSKLGADEFSQVKSAIPDTDSMMAAAPSKSGGIGSALGGMMSSVMGDKSGLGALASLAGGFSDLKIDSSLISKFIPIIMSFVKSKGGDGVAGLIEKVLK